jgi:peptidoglycan/xylan/chitin deacetylase (PgdA/CDA1 family)
MRFFAMICCGLLAATASAAAQTTPQASASPPVQAAAAPTEPSTAAPVDAAAAKTAAPAAEAPVPSNEPPAKPAEASTEAPAAQPAEMAVSKPIDAPATKTAVTTSEKPVATSTETSATPIENKPPVAQPAETPAAKPLEAATEKPATQPEASVAKAPEAAASEAPAAKPVEASTEKPAEPKVATAPITQPEEPASAAPVESSIEKPIALPPEKPVAQACPGHPDALGTSRVITITPAEFQRIGSMQYKQELPLKDHEVVLTFDDGPIPPYTNVILDELAAQCVKATYFLVGEMAHNFPYLVRRIYNAGHTIGTHSQDHPLGFQHLSEKRVEQEVDGGIASVDAALGDPKALSPFFRIPGLGRSETNEKFLAAHSLVTWSADVVADDWFRGIRPNQIVERAIKRLNEKGRGILLLHDIHPATVIALPKLLKELKEQGYRVVQVVAAGDRPKSLPDLVATRDDKGAWPRVLQAEEKAEKAGAGSHHKHRKVARHHRHHPAKHAVKRHHQRRHLAAK